MPQAGTSSLPSVSEAGREIDSLNRSAWSKPGVVEYFRTLDDWSEDAGEPAVVSRIAGEVAGRPVLDVGYGGGRTVPILTAISEDYVGIDYTPEMVAAAQARFPGIRLREAHRVLQPGGVLSFSTHNLDHRNAGRAPWDPRQRWPRDPRRVIRRLARLPIAARAYLRNRRLASSGDGWAMLNTPLYDFGLVIHYASLTEVIRELSAAGFAGEVEVLDMFGDSLGPGDDTGVTKWFHLVTRRGSG
jgi:SAM-dependent methyltransferase